MKNSGINVGELVWANVVAETLLYYRFAARRGYKNNPHTNICTRLFPLIGSADSINNEFIVMLL